MLLLLCFPVIFIVKLVENMGSEPNVVGRNFGLPTDKLRHIAYTTACCYWTGRDQRNIHSLFSQLRPIALHYITQVTYAVVIFGGACNVSGAEPAGMDYGACQKVGEQSGPVTVTVSK